MTTTPAAKLSKEPSPCPFCGKEAVVNNAINDRRWWIVGCSNEDCYVMPSLQEIGRAKAIKQWNRRAEGANNYHDAYRGARDDLLVWKDRALRAESQLHTELLTNANLADALAKEVNSPTFMGEPVFAPADPVEREIEPSWVEKNIKHVRTAVQSLAFQLAIADVMKQPTVFDEDRQAALMALRDLLPENAPFAKGGMES